MIFFFQSSIFLPQLRNLFLVLINHLPHLIGHIIDELSDLSLELCYDFAVIRVFGKVVDGGKDLGDGLESFHIILLFKDSFMKGKTNSRAYWPFLLG